MKRFLIILACCQFFLFQSCKEDDSAKPNPYAAKILSQLNPSDTFLFEVPLKNNQLDTAVLNYMRWQKKWLNLPSLQKGFDSLQIRIWYGCALGGDRLVALIHDGKSWKAELSNLIRHGGDQEGSSGYPDSLTKENELKDPKSGWVQFIDSLFDLKILTLPNEYDIPSFEKIQPMDGCGIAIEISTKNAYRLYVYNNPDLYIGEFKDYWQVKNIVEIMKLLSTEFNISEWPEGKLKTPEEINQKSKEGKIRVAEINLDSGTSKNK